MGPSPPGRSRSRSRRMKPCSTARGGGTQGADEAPLLSQQFEELDPTKVTRSGEGGRITAEDLKRFLERASSTAAVTLSPAVLNLVAEHGLDVARIPATGPQGRLTKEGRACRHRGTQGAASKTAGEGRSDARDVTLASARGRTTRSSDGCQTRGARADAACARP